MPIRNSCTRMASVCTESSLDSSSSAVSKRSFTIDATTSSVKTFFASSIRSESVDTSFSVASRIGMMISRVACVSSEALIDFVLNASRKCNSTACFSALVNSSATLVL